jgi:putative tryptophan/tyrosine transport system substrate-binding protein
MVPVRRRDFIKFILGSAAAWPLPLRAQQATKGYRIGYMGAASHAEYAREIEALLNGLRQLGYEEGKNITIHYQFAEGDYNRLPALAAELVSLKVDVLLTHSTPGARAARQATATVPIVVMAAADLVSTGVVPSIARPGGNLTGLTFFFAEICAKRIELIKEAVPAATRLGVLVNPANPSGAIALTAMQRTARALRVELLTVDVRAVDDIAGAFAVLASRGAQALTFIEDPLLISNARYIVQLATQNRLPMIGEKPAVEAGALMAYAVDRYDLWFRSAFFVDKILKGTQPADLPIDQAVKFELIINLKTAKTLGSTIPLPLLARADELIE